MGAGGGSGKSYAGLRGACEKNFDCTVHEHFELLASSRISARVRKHRCVIN